MHLVMFFFVQREGGCKQPLIQRVSQYSVHITSPAQNAVLRLRIWLSLNMQALGSGGEDCGWMHIMQVHERPRAAILLTACVGSGLQILCTMSFVLILACRGILVAPNRGAFLTSLLVRHSVNACMLSVYYVD
jgi:hypothetical protein